MTPRGPIEFPTAASRRGAAAWWFLGWFGFTVVFSVFFFPPDPISGLVMMFYGLVSFGLGSLFARAMHNQAAGSSPRVDDDLSR